MRARNIWFFFGFVLVLAAIAAVGTSYAQYMTAPSHPSAGVNWANPSDMRDRDIRGDFDRSEQEAALDHYDAVVQSSPNDPQAYNDRGVIHARMGDYHAAVADYSRSLQIDPAFAEAYQNRAKSYFRLGEYSRACSDLRHYRDMGGHPNPEFAEDMARVSGGGHC